MVDDKFGEKGLNVGVTMPLKHCTTTSVPRPVMALHLATPSPKPSSFLGTFHQHCHPSLIRPTRLLTHGEPLILHTQKQRNRASKGDVPSTFRYPPMNRKPRWWWRVLSSVPYLMPLHQSWVYSETAYHNHPFLEDFEFCTYPFLKAIGSLPAWFFMAYFFFAYLAVVRRKEWPHFFRFHVILGMLLDISLQVVGVAWRFLPQSVYWGLIGMHFWVAFTFAYLFTVTECVMCALCGMYADVPFLSDAAYAQIPYD